MATELTVTLYVGRERVEKLTDDQIKRMAQKIGEAMSVYYTQNPDEYKRIKEKKSNV